jgi:hypothetical protein
MEKSPTDVKALIEISLGFEVVERSESIVPKRYGISAFIN